MANYKDYTVTINFGGFIGCEQEYFVEGCKSREEAIEEAMEMAREDLEVVDVTEDDEEDEEDED